LRADIEAATTAHAVARINESPLFHPSKIDHVVLGASWDTIATVITTAGIEADPDA
jgi:hypothetical protein